MSEEFRGEHDQDAPGESDGADGTGGTTGGEGGGSGRARRPWWRSPVLAAVVCAVIIAGGGGYLLFGRGGGNTGSNAGGGSNSDTLVRASVLAAPGCTTSMPRLTTLRNVASHATGIGGVPSTVRHSPDGQYTFVTVPNGIVVLRNDGGLLLTRVRTVPVPGAGQGLTSTSDGHYLIATAGSGVAIVSVTAAELGYGQAVVGRLASPGGSGAVSALLSEGDKYLFVLQNSGALAVFNFGLAASSGFTVSHFIGSVPLGVQPASLGMSPDGNWLYTTSFLRTAGQVPGEGTLSVINVTEAEAHPAVTAVEATVNAGCSPAHVLPQRDYVWVTARDSNALLAFSAMKLQQDPSHALLAVVRVGPAPVGVVALSQDRLVIADSNQTSANHAPGNLAIVSTSGALASRHAVLGIVPANGQPTHFTRTEHVGTLLVTDQITNQLLAIKIANLP